MSLVKIKDNIFVNPRNIKLLSYSISKEMWKISFNIHIDSSIIPIDEVKVIDNEDKVQYLIDKATKKMMAMFNLIKDEMEKDRR